MTSFIVQGTELHNNKLLSCVLSEEKSISVQSIHKPQSIQKPVVCIDHAHKVFDKKKNFLELSIHVILSLGVYAKSGNLQDSGHLFVNMNEKNSIL